MKKFSFAHFILKRYFRLKFKQDECRYRCNFRLYANGVLDVGISRTLDSFDGNIAFYGAI